MDISFGSLDDLRDMIIAPDCPMSGPRLEKFQELAKAAKAHGCLIIGQLSHPGRQVQARLNPVAISASNVQLGKKILL